MHPQFRTLATPPWVRTAIEQYFDHLESQLTEMVLANPMFSRGGLVLKLTEIHRANAEILTEIMIHAKQTFAEHSPDEAHAWDQITVPLPYKYSRHDPLAARAYQQFAYGNLANDLRSVSNCVNARYYDRHGSLYFTLYVGGYRNPDAQFPTGLDRGNHDATLEIMRRAAHELTFRHDSLLFAWLQNSGNFRAPEQDDTRFFSPQRALEQMPDFRDESMDVDM